MSVIHEHISHSAVDLSSQRETGPTSRPTPANSVPVRTEAQTLLLRGPDTIVELSPQAVESATGAPDPQAVDPNVEADTPQHQEPTDRLQQRSASGKPLTQEQHQQVEQLKKRDQEVRRHEAAHKTSAGQFASGGPRFDFQTGPDGKQYAVGGEVQIDTSPIEGNPQATIRKMETIQRAALAPAEPSAQDHAVAAQAAASANQARQELRQQKTNESGGPTLRASTPSAPGADANGGIAGSRSSDKPIDDEPDSTRQSDRITPAGARLTPPGQLPERTLDIHA